MPQQDPKSSQFLKMTETPVPTLVLTLAGPTILSMLITSIYNLADTFFVGQISTSASGAVGVVSSLMAIIQALGFMLGHGAGTIISRSLGSRDTTAATLSAIIADEAAIGMVNSKTTAVRLIPAPGKVVGDTVEFGGLLGSAPVMPVHAESSDAFVARGGRIPAPMQSLKN